MAFSQSYQDCFSIKTFCRVHSKSKEVSYLSWQNKYCHLETTCGIKPKFVGNMAKGRISRRMFQENKGHQIFWKTNISYPLIRTRKCAYQGVRNIRFSKNLACFVPWNTHFWDSPFCHITDEFFLWAKLLESLLYNKYMISVMTRKFGPGCYDFKLRYFINRLWTIKGIVMQIEKALINDRLRVSKVFWKFCNPTIYNFAEIYPWNLLCS